MVFLPSFFFVEHFNLQDDFRKTFKEANPDNKKVAVVAKEGGEKWKSMTDEEKKPYIERAAELKEKYQKALENPTGAANEDDDKAEKESIDIDDDEGEGSPEKEGVANDE
ncbi:hypothetical protein L1987_72531 [Smallanthus sonchifolius]|uniref:Uncharacterized protein n=1 Tax=Smallanthus sonchifolius TaxID=185202 RepID=A0ACB9AX51_9ASTR|nr:hypothetical protein L1987_72531 [Smallanthus sonchifolius]